MDENGSKYFYQSKTVILNLLLLSLSEFHPKMKLFLNTHPDTVLLFSVVMNVILRHFTSSKLIFSKEEK